MQITPFFILLIFMSSFAHATVVETARDILLNQWRNIKDTLSEHVTTDRFARDFFVEGNPEELPVKYAKLAGNYAVNILQQYEEAPLATGAAAEEKFGALTDYPLYSSFCPGKMCNLAPQKQQFYMKFTADFGEICYRSILQIGVIVTRNEYICRKIKDDQNFER